MRWRNSANSAAIAIMVLQFVSDGDSDGQD